MFNLRKRINKIEVIREMLANLQPVSGSDTPIYDQLERDWAKNKVNW
jgi:hypothetical protein